MHVERITRTRPHPITGAETVYHVTEVYHYTRAEKALAKSRYALKMASAAAAEILRRELEGKEGGLLKSEVSQIEQLQKSLISQIALLTVRPLAEAGLFNGSATEVIRRSVPAQDDRNDMGDATDAGNPPRPKKSAHRQPGAEDVPHLDEERAKKLPKLLTPGGMAGGSDGIAKALEAEGFTYVERSAEGEHWIHGDLKHEAIVRSDDFLMKSGWSGETVRGTEVEGVALALAEMDS